MRAQLSVSMYVSTYSLKRMTYIGLMSLLMEAAAFSGILYAPSPCCLLLFVLMHPFVNFLLYIIILTYTYLICLPSWEFVLWKFPFFCPPLTHFCVSVYKKKANCNFLLLSSLPLFIYIWILLFFCQYKGGLEPCAQLLTHRMSLMENIY